jgi:hypothetical protein
VQYVLNTCRIPEADVERKQKLTVAQVRLYFTFSYNVV